VQFALAVYIAKFWIAGSSIFCADRGEEESGEGLEEGVEEGTAGGDGECAFLSSKKEIASSSVYLIMFDTFFNFSAAFSKIFAKSDGFIVSGSDSSMI